MKLEQSLAQLSPSLFLYLFTYIWKYDIFSKYLKFDEHVFFQTHIFRGAEWAWLCHNLSSGQAQYPGQTVICFALSTTQSQSKQPHRVIEAIFLHMNLYCQINQKFQESKNSRKNSISSKILSLWFFKEGECWTLDIFMTANVRLSFT